MKYVAVHPFNAYGVIAQEKGQEIKSNDETVLTNLVNIGYVKKVTPKKMKTAKED